VTEKTSPPLYRRIADDLAEAIRGGAYGGGRGLPSESELSRAYGVSRGTVRQAFAQLRASGVVSSRQGARRQAQGEQRLQSMSELLSFSQWALSIGEVPGSREITAAITGSTAVVAAALDLAEGSQVLHLVRVRLLSGSPAMLEDTYYPVRLAPLILSADLARDSLTERLEQQGVHLEEAEHHIRAVPATRRLADLLDVVEGAPLLRTTRRTTEPSGRVVEYSVDHYRGDAVAFVVRNSAASTTTARVTASGAG
jgi:GntR family transcriptional regulator